MKVKVIKLLSIVMMISIFTIGSATGVFAAEADFVYEDNGDGTATITDYIGTDTDVIIPSQLGGLTVTEIGMSAFESSGLTSVDIPNTITTIGTGAFMLNELTSLSIPESITVIGGSSFAFNGLTSLTIPENVTSIQAGAFSGNSLTTITVLNSEVSIGNSAFDDNSTELLIIGYDPSTAKDYADTNGYAFKVYGTETVSNNTNSIDFELQGGELSLGIPSILPFGPIKLQNEPKTYTTDFDAPFNLKDLRGTQEGWRVDVSATPFTIVEPVGGFVTGTSAHQLPVGSLSLSPLASIDQIGTGTGELPVSNLSSNTIIDDGIVTVATAAQGTGMGEFELTFPSDALSLVVDATTAKIDNINYADVMTPYEATLTWDLVSAP